MSIAASPSKPVRSASGDLRRLAVAQAISFAGGSSAYVALTASIYARTGSAVWVAAVAAASFALPSLASPLAGALGDRHDRRRVMACSEFLGAACFVVLALLSSPAAMVGAKALAGLLAAPFFGAAVAAVPRLAPAGELARANATLASWGTAGTLAGPLIGGLLTSFAGPSWVFLLNAGSFTVSAALISGLRTDLGPSPGAAAQDRGLGAGFGLLVSDPVLRRLSVGAVLLCLGMGTTLPAEIVRAHEVGVGAGGYGALISVWSAGGILGAQAAGRLLRGCSTRRLLVAAAAAISTAYLVAATATAFAVLSAGLALGGLAEGLSQVVNLRVMQLRAADALRSRALSARSALEQLGYSLPLLYAGPLVERSGAPAAFGIGALSCALAAAALARSLSPALSEQLQRGSGRL